MTFDQDSPTNVTDAAGTTGKSGTTYPAFPAGPVVSVEWLASHLNDDTVVVLCASMGDPEPARAAGIPGAFLADLDADFSDQSASLPHTVPANLKTLLQGYGISDDTTVVVYDRHGLMVAPRVWWLLRMAGVGSIGILDGGLPAWTAAGHETATLSEPSGGGVITTETDLDMLVGMEGVEKALARSNKVVVDARSSGRFAGVSPEPRAGLERGHIPGSVNLPFTEIVDEQGLLRPVPELKKAVEDVAGDATTLVFSCGSGVTACVDAYAAIIAGYRDVVIYDGSWTEWGNPANQKPIG